MPRTELYSLRNEAEIFPDKLTILLELDKIHKFSKNTNLVPCKNYLLSTFGIDVSDNPRFLHLNNTYKITKYADLCRYIQNEYENIIHVIAILSLNSLNKNVRNLIKHNRVAHPNLQKPQAKKQIPSPYEKKLWRKQKIEFYTNSQKLTAFLKQPKLIQSFWDIANDLKKLSKRHIPTSFDNPLESLIDSSGSSKNDVLKDIQAARKAIIGYTYGLCGDEFRIIDKVININPNKLLITNIELREQSADPENNPKGTFVLRISNFRKICSKLQITIPKGKITAKSLETLITSLRDLWYKECFTFPFDYFVTANPSYLEPNITLQKARTGTSNTTSLRLTTIRNDYYDHNNSPTN